MTMFVVAWLAITTSGRAGERDHTEVHIGRGVRVVAEGASLGSTDEVLLDEAGGACSTVPIDFSRGRAPGALSPFLRRPAPSREVP